MNLSISGAIVSPANPLYTVEELSRQIADSNATSSSDSASLLSKGTPHKSLLFPHSRKAKEAATISGNIKKISALALAMDHFLFQVRSSSFHLAYITVSWNQIQPPQK